MKSNKNNPRALQLLGEILLSRNDLEIGAAGFLKIHNADPTNFVALGMLFSFMRR
jgi:hypothetical protein